MDSSNRSSGGIYFAIVWLIFLIAGCSPTQPTSDYGASEGVTSRASPDGFAVLRQLCLQEGFATTTIINLPANAERKLSTLVWAPQDFYSHKAEAMDWVEQWLKSGGKTLVYVGVDYSPVEEYWRSTSQLYDSEEKRHEATVNAAFEKAKLLGNLIGGFKTIALPWGLYSKEIGEHRTVSTVAGEWGRDLDQRPLNIKIRSYFRVWSDVSDEEIEQLLKSNPPTANSGGTTSSGGTTPSPPSTPSPSNQPANSPAGPPSTQPNAQPPIVMPWLNSPTWGGEYVIREKTRRESIKSSEQTERAEAADDEEFWGIFGGTDTTDDSSEPTTLGNASTQNESLNHEIVLQGPDELPLISVVSKPDWNGSRIVLVANASLVSNLSMTYDGNRVIAERLVETFSDGRVGFFSQRQDPMVLDGESGSTGLSSLLTRPVNLLAAHLVFFGLVALLYLWPIFGRPAELPTPSTQSFSLHINALGSLLQKAKDEFYARTTIADYFKQVKRDHNSPWASLDAPYEHPSASPFRGDDVNSATTKSND